MHIAVIKRVFRMFVLPNDAVTPCFCSLCSKHAKAIFEPAGKFHLDRRDPMENQSIGQQICQ
jgi:hypothetical protein